MNKPFLLFIMCCGTALSLYSQAINIVGRAELNALKAFHPVFNATGDKLLFTSENYTGLSLLNLTTKDVRVISSDPGAGRQPEFASDESSICFFRTVAENRQKIKSLVQYDTNSGKEIVLAESKLNDAPQSRIKSSVNSGVYVTTEKLKLVVYNNKKRTELDPVNDPAGYIWPSLSPDGRKIVFTSLSKGTFVCDLEGKILASIGNVNAPVWYGNLFVVGMEDKDNGLVMTSSKIIIKSLKGDMCETLSDENEIAIYPATSFLSNQVVYSSDKGDLRIVKLSISEQFDKE